MAEEPVLVEHVSIPRAVVDDLHAAFRFIAWAKQQRGDRPLAMGLEWLETIEKTLSHS